MVVAYVKCSTFCFIYNIYVNTFEIYKKLHIKYSLDFNLQILLGLCKPEINKMPGIIKLHCKGFYGIKYKDWQCAIIVNPI